MKILVIGGTRFIGPCVVRDLAGLGHEVTVFHRGHSHSEMDQAAEHLHGDRSALADFIPEFRRLDPDVVLDMLLMNQADAVQLMQTFKGIAGKVVVLSSQDVYRAYGRLIRTEPGNSGGIDGLITEDSPLRQELYPYRGHVGLADKPKAPTDPLYHYDKILVERAVMADPDLPGTVLRLPCVYGPGDYQHRMYDYIRRMDDGRPVILLPEGMYHWRWTRGYVDDVAAAIALAATDDRAINRIYNCGEKQALSEADWVRSIGDAAGWRGEVVHIPSGTQSKFAGPDYDWSNHLETDSIRIRQELGFEEKIDHREAIARTVEWERAHPPAEIDEARFDYAGEDELLRQLGHGTAR